MKTSARSGTVVAPKPSAKNETGAALLASIVDSSYDAIVGKTLDGVITTWNKAAERIYGDANGIVIGASSIARDITAVLRGDANLFLGSFACRPDRRQPLLRGHSRRRCKA